jgi:hypothetical protein
LLEFIDPVRRLEVIQGLAKRLSNSVDGLVVGVPGISCVSVTQLDVQAIKDCYGLSNWCGEKVEIP